jgi:Excalibur calcium-binding domain
MRALMLVLAAASAVLLAAPANAGINDATAPAAGGLIPRLYKNCTNLNKRYPHGVGRRLARDKTSGTPVTNFRRSTVLYNTAMRYNRGLDRDKDGIACEKR